MKTGEIWKNKKHEIYCQIEKIYKTPFDDNNIVDALLIRYIKIDKEKENNKKKTKEEKLLIDIFGDIEFPIIGDVDEIFREDFVKRYKKIY